MPRIQERAEIGTITEPVSILVIDDSPIDRDLFRRFLLDGHPATPFKPIEVERGQTGLDQFRRVHPDCVLLDLNLPDIDGLDLLRAILGEPNACPVIVTTAYGSEQVAVDAMKAGAADYLVKGSINAESLTHVVRNALEKRRLEQQVERQRLAIEERNRQLEEALERERTARKAVEESEFRYRTLAEAMPQVVWTATHPAGAWDYVNERWTHLTGAPVNRAFGSGWLEFVYQDDRPRVIGEWRSAITSAAPLALECRIVSAGGAGRLQLIRALPLLHDGEVSKWFGTFTDIEDQRRTEQLLHQRQKLESIGILAGGVAHDFNNLLVGIIGGISFALDALAPNHDLRQVLESALRAGDRAAQLTRQLLAYAGKGEFQIQEVDFAQCLRATWDLIQASLPRSIDLKVSIPPDLPCIRTDPAQLQQIVMNLILNASEAIPQDRRGVVVVRADRERIEAPRSSWGSDVLAGEYVSIEVHDNGSGIDPAVLNRIFDPFFTTKFTGRGLGLAAVQGIIRSNKGAIDVSSIPGQGTTFRVLLPAGSANEKKPDAAPAQHVKPASKGRILVVDDEPIVRNTAKLILERSGHAVEVASGGQEALACLSSAPEFSLVLLDLNMPGLDGKQTFEAIRRVHRDLPVLICSGYSDSEVRSRFPDGAVNGFVQKPFQARNLSQKVSDILSPG
ncbi:MAG: response regulator [Bryobacteraceae bacterium]